MHFRTELTVNKSLLQLHHKSSFLTIGSCFAEEIGSLLQANKFNTFNNLLGTTFNPVSIAAIMEAICHKNDTQRLPLQTGEVWLDYRFHSSIYGYSEQELNETIDQKLEQARQQLSQPGAVCIITLGTAWLYRLLAKDTIVANCHKQSSALFRKELCSAEQLLESMQHALNSLFQHYPHCQVILTLSPVRHTKDGLEENQISKSLLRVLCHQLSTTYPSIHYFPSYEIVLDDLRDYRFYSKDLVHPNELAIAYIWDKFRQCFFDKDTNSLLDQWQQVKQSIQHKPFYEKSNAHKKFLERTLTDLEALHQKIDVTQEIMELKQTIQRHS